MNRRGAFIVAGFAAVAIATVGIVRCQPPIFTVNFFSYAPHERPRVFVSHHPLKAEPGQRVTIRLTPDLRTEDGAVNRATASLRNEGAGTLQQNDCSAQSNGSFACEFTLPAGDGRFTYDGAIELQNGARVSSLSVYRFEAVTAPAANTVVVLREPVNNTQGLSDSYRIDTAWIQDATTTYTRANFFTDVESSVYDGILADPVYRWRDRQLGFYFYSDNGFTSSYYSGFDTRCGQNPWPAETALRAALNNMEVMALLHRHPTSRTGIEGQVTGTNFINVFRDCAGTAVKNPNIRSFSTTGGLAETPRIAKHEFSHAAFGLGDEYTESQATRNVAPATVNPLDTSCCCDASGGGIGVGVGGGGGGVVDNGGVVVTPPGTPGGGQSLQCIRTGGGLGAVPGGGLGGSRPACSSFQPPPNCGASPQGGCPSLFGDCVSSRMWLGASPIPASARPNVFATQAECDATRTLAQSHPGVEDKAASLGACRELCGPTTAACPCGVSEAWIVDTNPATTAPQQDSMGTVLAQREGGTCALCVETSLCVRWHRARGDSAEQAWQACEAPPADAVERERGVLALLRAILEWIESWLRRILF